ncbi:hypothetical protein AB4Y32_21120 [Paraburkholderia phymatum]|uniref:Uncharacterized protein n=1 Tax=Paraburkholderia phymatum TaxID=148447 RepID=A0ACC6U3Z1_9BURK
MQVDVSRARSLYEQAIELGHRAAAHNLGLFWEGLWGVDDNGFIPDRTKAMQSYRRGGDDKICHTAWKRCVEFLPPASRAVGRFQAAHDGYFASVDKGKVEEKTRSGREHVDASGHATVLF